MKLKGLDFIELLSLTIGAWAGHFFVGGIYSIGFASGVTFVLLFSIVRSIFTGTYDENI